MKEKIKCVVVPPVEKPYVFELENSLDAMHEIVGGYIEVAYLGYNSSIVAVVNEEGKVNGLPLSRAVLDDNGEILDIIAGTFFVCSAPPDSEDFESLTDEQITKVMEYFKNPEMFFKVGNKIKVVSNTNKPSFDNFFSH